MVLGALFFPFRDWPGFTLGILSDRVRKSFLKECQNIPYLDVPEQYNLQMKHSTELLRVHVLHKYMTSMYTMYPYVHVNMCFSRNIT